MIYLASKSPQRKKLLRLHGIRFKCVRSAYREINSRKLSPRRNALRHAEGKARACGRKTGIILAADTVVSFRGRIYGKPRDKKHARAMLGAFSDKSQEIITAVVLRNAATGKTRSFAVTSRVAFRCMTDEDIRRYLATGEYRNKAGSFGLQGRGARFIKSVRGSRTNVIGLPMERLKRELRRFGA